MDEEMTHGKKLVFDSVCLFYIYCEKKSLLSLICVMETSHFTIK